MVGKHIGYSVGGFAREKIKNSLFTFAQVSTSVLSYFHQIVLKEISIMSSQSIPFNKLVKSIPCPRRFVGQVNLRLNLSFIKAIGIKGKA